MAGSGVAGSVLGRQVLTQGLSSFQLLPAEEEELSLDSGASSIGGLCHTESSCMHSADPYAMHNESHEEASCLHGPASPSSYSSGFMIEFQLLCAGAMFQRPFFPLGARLPCVRRHVVAIDATSVHQGTTGSGRSNPLPKRSVYCLHTSPANQKHTATFFRTQLRLTQTLLQTQQHNCLT